MTTRMELVAGLAMPAVCLAAAAALAEPPCGPDETAPDPSRDCQAHPVTRTRCVIAALLDDVGRHYRHHAGGGITSIEQAATWTWVVSIGREGRIDRITYRVEPDEHGGVRIVGRELVTQRAGPEPEPPEPR